MSRVLLDRYHLSRRRLIQTFGGAAITALSIPLLGARPLAPPVFATYPFQLGVASGDPAPDGFVIWTRLAPQPFEIGYGMPSQSMEVAWEVATDDRFAAVVAKGAAVAMPELGHSVHVEVEGLQPGRDYWYRFTAGRERSAVGRSKTTPALGSAVDQVRFGVAGCQNYENGYYTAYRKMAAETLDFIFCYGDYIYEGSGVGAASKDAPPPRRHFGGEIYALDDYRRRYAQYKLDPDLQAAHASAPWFVVWDDHETDNNWVGELDQDGTDPKVFNLRREAAVQAYYENMPLRASAFPTGTAMQIYRRAAYGRLLDLNLLDTRQFRTDQPCGDKQVACTELDRLNAEMIGLKQEKWLVDGLSSSKASWNVLAQQVMMMDLDRNPGPEVVANPDSWAGYRTPRNRLLKQVRDRKIGNLIVLTGDEHQNFAGELQLDGRRPEARPIGTEFVITSISSGGDGVDQRDDYAKIQADNPQLKFNNNQRGYAVCDVTPQRWITEFKVLDAVSRADGALSTRARLAVESGDPKIVTA